MLKEPIKAIFSFKFYHTIKEASAWRAILYGIYIFALYIIIVGIVGNFIFNPKISNFINKNADKMPPIVLQDGKLNINNDKFLAVILRDNPKGKDTIEFKDNLEDILLEEKDGLIVAETGREGAVDIRELQKNNIVVYITKNSIYSDDGRGNMRITKTDDAPWNFTITSEKIKTNKNKITNGILLIMLFSIGFYVVLKMFFFIVYFFFVGLIVNSAKSGGFSAGTIFKWAIYAITPIMVLGLISTLASIKIPFVFLVYTAIGAVYFVNILKIKEEKDDIENKEEV